MTGLYRSSIKNSSKEHYFCFTTPSSFPSILPFASSPTECIHVTNNNKFLLITCPVVSCHEIQYLWLLLLPLSKHRQQKEMTCLSFHKYSINTKLHLSHSQPHLLEIFANGEKLISICCRNRHATKTKTTSNNIKMKTK